MTSKEKLYCLAGGIAVLATFIFTIPIWIIHVGWIRKDYMNTGQLGDTVGGFWGPGIGFIGAILTFLAFYVQYQANQQQKADLKDQKKNWLIERFESRYFELIKLHKDNVSEMNIADRLFGRRCFVPMFYELRYIYLIARIHQTRMATAIPLRLDILAVDILKLTYAIFFYGTGGNSEKQFVHKLNPAETDLFAQVKGWIENMQEIWVNHSAHAKSTNAANSNKSNDDKCLTYNKPVAKPEDDLTIELYYKPYNGHVNLLGHYYRHMFQAAKYVVEQEFLTEKEKYGYIKTFRAQLSNFEQLLLYYNAMAWFDEEWRELFTKYKFIKNIPLDLADFDVNPKEKYADYIKWLMEEKDEKLFELQ